MTKLPMRWECGAPLWAWCCCVPGTNCGKRWKATRPWRREGPHEQHAGREDEASGRNDAPAVHRAATGSRARAGSFRAHARMRHVPHTAPRHREGIAAADAGDAGRRRTAAFAAGAISRTRAQVDAMDLGSGFRTGGDGSLRALYGIYPALATANGTSGIRRVEPVGPADFLRRHVERVAIHDDTPRGAGGGDARRTGENVLPAADPARFGAGAGLRGVLHRAGAANRGFRDGASRRTKPYGEQG